MNYSCHKTFSGNDLSVHVHDFTSKSRIKIKINYKKEGWKNADISWNGIEPKTFTDLSLNHIYNNNK